MLRRWVALLVSLSAAACGGDVVSNPGQSGDEASGSGAAAVASSGAGASAVASSATSGVGGSASCGDAYVEVSSNMGSGKLVSSCAETWGAMWSPGAVGFYVNGGPAPGAHFLNVEGCATQAAESEGLRLGVEEPVVAGDYSGTAVYRDSQGQYWTETNAAVKISFGVVGPVGGIIDGSYAGTVFLGAGVLDIQGTFHVCHVEDENVP